MYTKSKRTAAIVLNIIVILCTAGAVGSFWFSGGTGNMQVAGAKCLKFYTTLSNIFGGLGALWALGCEIVSLKKPQMKLPLPAYWFRFSSAVCLAVTFITTALFLSPLLVLRGGNYFLYFMGATFFLHFLTPLLTVLTVTRLEETENFEKKQVLLAVLPTLLYAVVYSFQVVRGPAHGGWNDFYGFTFGGNLILGAVSLLVMMGLAAAMSFGLAAICRRG